MDRSTCSRRSHADIAHWSRSGRGQRRTIARAKHGISTDRRRRPRIRAPVIALSRQCQKRAFRCACLAMCRQCWRLFQEPLLLEFHSFHLWSSSTDGNALLSSESQRATDSPCQNLRWPRSRSLKADDQLTVYGIDRNSAACLNHL